MKAKPGLPKAGQEQNKFFQLFNYDHNGVLRGLAQMLVKDNKGGEVLAPAAAGIVCAACGASVSPGKFCGACGESMEQQAAASDSFCTGCGSPMGPDAQFCGQCGVKRED